MTSAGIPVTGQLDHEAFAAWIDTLRVEGSGTARQVRLADDDLLRPGLAALVVGLSNAEPAGASSTQILQEILLRSSEISASPQRDLLSNYIRGHFEYFENIIRPINGRGLKDIFSAFASTIPADDIAQSFRNGLKEFIVYAETALREYGHLDSPADSPLAHAVVVNGHYRTGSTKVFLAAMGILRAAHRSYIARGADLTQVDEILNRLAAGAYRGKWVLLKSHYWMPLKSRPSVITLFTRRNLADVIASVIRRATASRKKMERDGVPVKPMVGTDNRIEALRWYQFIDTYVIPKYDLNIIDYEEYYGRDDALITRLCVLMNISLSEAQRAEAVKFMAVERARDISASIPGDAKSDPETFVNLHHVSDTLGRPGAGLHVLPREVIDDLKRFGEWPADADS